jgi:hypothetical protein
MLMLNRKTVSHDGDKRSAVAEDLLALRQAKRSERRKLAISLDEVKRQHGIKSNG